MTNFRMMITEEGKHPPEKWAQLAADEIIDISAKAPAALVREATEFRVKLVHMMTAHHRTMMEQEQRNIADGKHAMHLPYETEDYASEVVNEICKLAKGTSFEEHFKQDEVWSHLEAVCNRNFKSAMLVERHHFHSEKALAAPVSKKKK